MFISSAALFVLFIFYPNRFEPVKDIDKIYLGGETAKPNECCYLRCFRVPCSFEASECGSTCERNSILQPHVRSAACAVDNETNKKDNKKDDKKDDKNKKNCTLTVKEKVKAVYCRVIIKSPVGVECPTGQVRCIIKTAEDIPAGLPLYEEVYVEPKAESLNSGKNKENKNINNVCSNTNNRDNKEQRSMTDEPKYRWAYECSEHIYE
jgi:hypothetical protein